LVLLRAVTLVAAPPAALSAGSRRMDPGGWL